jgi:transcriptional regulator GlxA family with amidase domain
MTVSESMNPHDFARASQQTSGGILVVPVDKAASALFEQLRQPIRGGLPPRALRRVREYVQVHLATNISIQMLAAVAGFSMYHFARAFKQSEGVTPHCYLVRCRVRRAQELLAQTDMSLAEIARASGFSDQSHCTRRFREHVGVTPSSYRWSMS